MDSSEYVKWNHANHSFSIGLRIIMITKWKR